MKRKATLPKITSPAMMGVGGVIYECLYDTYSVVMEEFVNNNLDDTTIKYLNEINEIGVYEEGGDFFYGK